MDMPGSLRSNWARILVSNIKTSSFEIRNLSNCNPLWAIRITGLPSILIGLGWLWRVGMGETINPGFPDGSADDQYAMQWILDIGGRIFEVVDFSENRSEERRVGKECRSRWS